MFCDKCGAKLKDDARFCYNCGSKIKIDSIKEQEILKSVASTQSENETIKADEDMFPGNSSLKTININSDINEWQEAQSKEKPEKKKKPVKSTKPKSNNFFKDNIGIICIISLWIASVVLSAVVGKATILFRYEHLKRLLRTWFFVFPLAVSAAITIKSKGLDLSVIGAVIIMHTFIGMTGSVVLGIFIALPVCILLGIINAIIINNTKIHASIITMLVSSIVALLFYALSKYELNLTWTFTETEYYLIGLGAAVVSTLLYFVLFKRKRETLKDLILVYTGSAVLIWLFRVLYFIRIGGCHSIYGYISQYLDSILLFALVICSFINFEKGIKTFLLLTASTLIFAYAYLNFAVPGFDWIIYEISIIAFIILLFLVIGSRRQYFNGNIQQPGNKKTAAVVYVLFAGLIAILLSDILSIISLKVQYLLSTIIAAICGVFYYITNKETIRTV